MSNNSYQGKNYRKKVIEGFTNQQGANMVGANDDPNINNQDFNTATDDISKQVSQLARSQQQTMSEARNYLQVSERDSKYLNKIVKTQDGTIGYITNKGIFKPFDNMDDVQATLGKNGCPANIENIDTKGSTYTKDGRYLNTDTPVFVGSSMVKGQLCGYAGQNIFVSQPSPGSNESNYDGCKRGDGLISTGIKMDIDGLECPVGTFQCPGGKKGFCYDPKRDWMVSTYRMPQYDAPIGKVENKKSTAYLADDGVTYLWFREGGFNNCGNMAKPTMPPCPKGTAPCPTNPGICWDPSRKMMVTTISPKDNYTPGKPPTYMALVNGDMFNYSEDVNPYVYRKQPDNLRMGERQKWRPDRQFEDPNFIPNNKVYLQFKAAAAQLMPYLNNNGTASMNVYSFPNEISWTTQNNSGPINKIAGTFKVNGVDVWNNKYLPDIYDFYGGKAILDFRLIENTIYQYSPQTGEGKFVYFFDQHPGTFFGTERTPAALSHGAKFTVTKINDQEAIGHLQNGEGLWSMQTKYQFEKPIPKADDGFLAQDGVTRLWKKQDGYDESCGPKSEVPPINKVDELFKTCKAVANSGGFSIFGIKDGECFVGNSVNSLTPGSECEDMNGINIGKNDDFATYKIQGASNKGLYQYGYVTDDEKLKIFSFDNATQSRTFKAVGKQQIIKTPRFKVFTDVNSMEDCEKKCVDEYGNSCEAYGYNRQTKGCTAYGKDALKMGAIIPGGNELLNVRSYEFEHDVSCPKSFNSVNSYVWDNLPIDGFIDSSTKCGLGYVTEEPQSKQIGGANVLNENVGQMKDIISQQFKQSQEVKMMPNLEEQKLRANLSEYDKLYNQALKNQ